MKILIISQYWAPENGVPQRRWSWLTGVLEAEGHSVTVIAPPPHYNRSPSLVEWWKSGSFRAHTEHQEINHAQTVVRTGFFPAGRSLTQRILNQAAVASAALWVILKKPGVLKAYEPDLIIGSVPALPTAVVAYIASKRFSAPYVIDLRDAWPDLISEHDRWNSGLGEPSLREKLLSRGPVQLLGMLTKRAINFSLRSSDALLVTSSKLGNSLSDQFTSYGASSSKPVAVVRNVFPVEIEHRKLTHDRSEPKQLRVLYAGTLGRAQNLTNAVRAVAIAQQDGYDIAIRFVGAGAARQELVRVAKELQVSVEFSSRIAAEDLSEHYDWADTALVHLTNWPALEQAVPSKTYELMSCGIHISAVVSGETKEIVEELGAGHVVTPELPRELASLWESLIDSPEKLKVSDAGATWVEMQRKSVAPEELLRVIRKFESN
ncbi:glycosyltransferase family 4 protein [Corynebacterium casei]|uniref:glycosyltransferase family 4 protein n=1 Tax=Corynebacterium casei TaxID=160386 RepID=UPI001867709F|nr:glycosyltransferase family 4 protein [Corynebacterium casei]